MAARKHKNADWQIPEKVTDWNHCLLAVLMDIRDELQSIDNKLSCYRIPRALDALNELGVDLRRKKRLAATRRKNAKAKGKHK